MSHGCGIYEIRNLVNGKRYVGQSVSIKRRQYEHLSCLRRGKHRSAKLQHAWNKYGESNFVFSELECVERDKGLLASRENFHIAQGSEYNICPAGESSLGHKWSAESRARLSAARKGKLLTAEHRAKVSLALTGRPVSPETQARLSAAQKGRFFTETHKQNLRQSRARQVCSAATRQKMSLSRMGNQNARRVIKPDP